MYLKWPNIHGKYMHVHVYPILDNMLNTKGRLHDKSLKITLSLNSRLTAVDCIKSGLTSLRLTLSLNSRLLVVDCIKEV